MSGDEVIAIYESIAKLTDQMLAAAKNSDWPLLTALEAQCGNHIATLRAFEEGISLSEQHRNRKVDIIRKILEDDRDIRNLTEPGLKRLSALIHNNHTERKLASTYGVGS